MSVGKRKGKKGDLYHMTEGDFFRPLFTPPTFRWNSVVIEKPMKVSSSRITSNGFESRRIKPNLVKFNQIKLNQTNLDLEEPNQI